MEHYRSYMDRVKLSPEEHRALMDALEGERRPARRPSPARWVTAAACLALVCAAAFGMWRLAGLPGGDTDPDRLLEDVPGTTGTLSPDVGSTESVPPELDSEYVRSS